MVEGLLRERDHLLLLHEALAKVERSSTMDERLRVFVEAIRGIGFGRVMLTLRDAELNAKQIVCAGLSPEEERFVNDDPTPGAVWQRRLAAIERFRISNSYYLDGTDPWVIAELGLQDGGEHRAVRSTLPVAGASDWSPRDTLIVPLRDAAGNVTGTLALDEPDDRARPSLTRVRTVELFAQQVASMVSQAEHLALAERHRRVVETSSDAIVITDRDHRISFANPAAIELIGRGPDVIGLPAASTVPADMAALIRDREERALAGEPQRYEAALQRPDGERRLVAIMTAPLRERGEVTGIVASLRDVTEERRALEAVAQSEARYSRLVESAPDGIFTLSLDGLLTSANRSLQRAVGRQRDELLGATLDSVVDPRDVAAMLQLLGRTFAGERTRGQLRYRSAGGESRHASVILSPIFEGKAITGALGIVRDMTDEIRLTEQLLQQEKLAAVGQLVSGVAHELNNPLAGVMAFSQLLLASPASHDVEARQAAETIHREAQRAAKIVANLLTFARQRPAERAETDLNALVTDTLELRRYNLRSANIRVEATLDDALPHTWADPFQLQQVLLNLIGNAEHILADWDGERRITIRTWRDGAQLGLSVSDTGPGVPNELRDRIFNPFFTTKPVGQGTGLGLSITDGIAREHGGRLRVESTEGQGATFILELPFAAVPASAPEVRAPNPRSGSRLGHVLVVDDEASMRSAISAFLRSLGHDVTVAGGGVDARRLLANAAYDAILLDLRLGDVGGDVLFRELRARDAGQAARVVFVTGDTQSETARRFLTESGRPSLGKPFQLDDLATVIAVVMR